MNVPGMGLRHDCGGCSRGFRVEATAGLADRTERGIATVAHSGAGTLGPGVIERLGLTKGMIVQEFLRDDDVDEGFRAGVAKATGNALVDEGYGDVTDAAIVWYRSGDDDLADLLMDAQTLLDDGASIWILTPKAGRDGHVEQRDIEEGASLAGLHATLSFVACDGWAVTQLVEKGRHK